MWTLHYVNITPRRSEYCVPFNTPTKLVQFFFSLGKTIETLLTTHLTWMRGNVSGGGNSRSFGLLNVFKWRTLCNPFFGNVGKMLLPKFLNGDFYQKLTIYFMFSIINDVIFMVSFIKNHFQNSTNKVKCNEKDHFEVSVCNAYKSSSCSNTPNESSWIKKILFPSKSL